MALLRALALLAIAALALAAPAYDFRPAPCLHKFTEEYLRGLSECDISGVRSKLSSDYLLYPSDGDSYGRAVFISALEKFCAGPLKGAKFQLREIKQVAPNVMFFRASLSHPLFKTPRNRVLYSQAISVKLALDTYKIYRDVRTLNAGQIAAALKGK